MKTIHTLVILLTTLSMAIAQNSTASTELPMTHQNEPAIENSTLTFDEQVLQHTENAVEQLKAQLIAHIEYTDEMISLGKEGTVTIEILLNTDGSIARSSIAESLHPRFDQAVVSAAEYLKAVEIEGEQYVGVPKVFVPIVFKLMD